LLEEHFCVSEVGGSEGLMPIANQIYKYKI